MNWTRTTNNLISPAKMFDICPVDFSHCASICAYGPGVLICFYAGSRECANDQAVYVTYWDTKEYHEPICMGMRTGNPIIWASHKNTAALIFSLFEKDTPNPVQKWMYCTNWITYIEWASGTFSRGTPKRIKTDPKLGFLARCQPIKARDPNTWLIPLYREHNCYGEIWSHKHRGSVLKRLGKIGVQSTIRTGFWRRLRWHARPKGSPSCVQIPSRS